MPDNLPPSEDGLFGEDPSKDPMYTEEQNVRECIEELSKLVSGESPGPITNENLFKYLRIVNFNFATLSKMLHAIYFRQGLIEESLLTLQTDLKNLVDANALLDQALDIEKNDDVN